MGRENRDVDPLPDEFTSLEEAAEFWDKHDTTEYPDAFEDVPFEIEGELRERHFEVEVEADLIGALRERAHASGTTVNWLVSRLLRQQLATS